MCRSPAQLSRTLPYRLLNTFGRTLTSNQKERPPGICDDGQDPAHVGFGEVDDLVPNQRNSCRANDQANRVPSPYYSDKGFMAQFSKLCLHESCFPVPEKF